MTNIIHEPKTFLLHRLYYVSGEKSIQLTVNVRSSIKTILISKSLEKKTLRILPHPLGNCLLLDPFPLGISDILHEGGEGWGEENKPNPGIKGDSFHFVMDLCRYT